MRKFGEGESKYLKSSDLEASPGVWRYANCTILGVAWEDVAPGDSVEEKWILYFVGKVKGLALNVTNERVLGDLFGSPMQSTPEGLTEWLGGQRVQVYVNPHVEFQGKVMAGLRLRGVPPAADAPKPFGDQPQGEPVRPMSHQPASPEPPPAEVEHAPTAQPIADDDIPF